MFIMGMVRGLKADRQFWFFLSRSPSPIFIINQRAERLKNFRCAATILPLPDTPGSPVGVSEAPNIAAAAVTAAEFTYSYAGREFPGREFARRCG
jgi:hypothetical protein